MAGATAVKLPYFIIENVQFRTIYLIDEHHFGLNPKGQGTLLLLGSDIISHFDLDPKNHCRCHSRYAKKKLAAKVNFQGLRIDGISNSGSVWFYSVQGMFKLCFENSNTHMQKICLQYLADKWVEDLNTSPLQEHMQLSLDSQSYGAGDIMILSLPDTENQLHPQLPETDRTNALVVSKTSRVETTSFCDQTSEVVPLPEVSENVCEGDGGAVLRKINLEESELSGIVQCIVNSEEELLSFLDLLYQHLPHEYTNSWQTLNVNEMLSLLLELLKVECSVGEERGFPFELLNSYTETARKKADATNGYVSRRELALRTISSWLGAQFCALGDSISATVEKFKLDHINCIDNLPEAKQLIAELFPDSMIQLFVQWMKRESIDSANDTGCSPQRKKMKKTEKSEESMYPVIQMILEFVNNALISGVAHVVYSRLLHS